MERPPPSRPAAGFVIVVFSLVSTSIFPGEVPAGPVAAGKRGAGEAAEPPAAPPAAAPVERSFELLPFIPWAQTGALATLAGPPPEPLPLAPRGTSVLKALREKAGVTWSFTLRGLASREDLGAFESSFGAAARAAAKDPPQARPLAAKLVHTADGLKEDAGLRRLLLTRALALALQAAGGEEELERTAKLFRASLSSDVPADLTAGVLAAEVLASRPEEAAAGELRKSRREALREARLDLFRFQVRHGYLDEAGETLSRVLKEAGADPGDELKGLRRRLDSRLALRERYRKLLRDADARPDDGVRFRELAIFILAGLRDATLASAAASKADHPALKAFADARSLGTGRGDAAQVECLVDLIPIASAPDRPGLAALARERLEDLEALAAGAAAERVKAIRARFEESLRQGIPALPSLFVKVPARTAWVASGFQVRKGRRYHITAEGKWSIGKSGKDAEVDAAGSGGLAAAAGKLPPGALVAQIGPSLDTVLIGRELFLAAPESGEIFFSMNDAFREFDDNSGEVLVRIEAPPESDVPRPRRPPDFAGRWLNSGQGRTARDLLPDGTCRTGAVQGTWVARNAREAVLRWSNGAVERMTITVPGSGASLIGHTGRTFTLAKEAPEEKKKAP